MAGRKFPRNEFQNSSIKCIVFCEFHATAGPKITFQVPNDYVTKEDFDSLSVYLIPKPELQGRLITVNACNLKIIGFPCGIDNQIYPRNRLLFNLCFVCDATMRTTQYEPIVRKLARYLVDLELECNFLFNESTKSLLPLHMTQIRNQLNQNGSCVIQITESTTIHLKVNPVHLEPGKVEDHDVPVFSVSEGCVIPSQWDLTTQQWDLMLIKVLPYIDGYRHVSRIASEADVELSLVKACIQNMLYYGVITLIPIFQYSNVYVPTPKIGQLLDSSHSHLQEECLQFVARAPALKPDFRFVFQLFTSMSAEVTLKDLCVKFNPQAHGIDEKKLVRFGIMKGLIRRLQKYPVCITAENGDSVDHYPRNLKHERVRQLFDGNHSYDQICCKTGKCYQEIDQLVERTPSTIIVWK